MIHTWDAILASECRSSLESTKVGGEQMKGLIALSLRAVLLQVGLYFDILQPFLKKCNERAGRYISISHDRSGNKALVCKRESRVSEA